MLFQRSDSRPLSVQILPILTGLIHSTVALGDFNGDDALDVAVTDRDSGSVIELLNDCLVALPTLRATPKSNGIILSWPARFSDFTLGWSPSLNSDNWSPLSNSPGLSHGRFEVLAPFTTEPRFFRLQKNQTLRP